MRFFGQVGRRVVASDRVLREDHAQGKNVKDESPAAGVPAEQASVVHRCGEDVTHALVTIGKENQDQDDGGRATHPGLCRIAYGIWAGDFRCAGNLSNGSGKPEKFSVD